MTPDEIEAVREAMREVIETPMPPASYYDEMLDRRLKGRVILHAVIVFSVIAGAILLRLAL